MEFVIGGGLVLTGVLLDRAALWWADRRRSAKEQEWSLAHAQATALYDIQAEAQQVKEQMYRAVFSRRPTP